MNRIERPLSPYVGIYRLGITGWPSIVHRLTGLALSAGAIVLIAWLVAVASGPGAYQALIGVIGTGWFKSLLLGWTFCFFYHLANGIRHLFWDAGMGFGHTQIRVGGWTVIVFAVVATVAFAVAALS